MNGTKKRKRRIASVHLAAAFVCLALTGLLPLGGCRPQKTIPVEISEVVSRNERSYWDEEYGATDWIELHNVSDRSVSLDGWFLTDKGDALSSDFALPNVTLPPDGYCLIFADKEKADRGRRCLPFGLDKDGDTLFLFDADGEQVAALQVPALEKDVSWALDRDGQYGYCASPTPGAANDTGIEKKLSDAPARSFPRSYAELWINEIYSGSSARDGDWIELFNPTDEAVSVKGFHLSDRESNPEKGTLPSLIVPAQGYLAVPVGPAADPEQGIASFSISSEGETLYLFDEDLGLIDTVDVPAVPAGTAFARGADGVFGYSGVPTPGAANTGGIYAEPLRPMSPESPVHISEGLFCNRYSAIDAYGDHSDWVELVNESDSAILLDGFYLSDRKDDLKKWALPPLELGPGEYVLVFLSGRDETAGELHASFSVSERDDGCCLFNANTLEWECLPCPGGLADNVSVGFSEDGTLLYFGYPTPGQPNAQGFIDQDACALPNGGLLISEVCAGGEAGDWIELYNRSAKEIDLSGWHLSDDELCSEKLALGPAIIPAGAYHVITLAKGTEAAPFSISLSGEELVLTDGNGIVRDVFATGALRQEMTSGRQENDPACRRVFFASATPGQANLSAIVAGYAAAPTFSDTSLYHEAPFTLALTAAGEGTEIRYTLDGSAPTERSALYSEPLTIDKNTVVRAVGVAHGCFTSEERVATFLFRQPHTLPVVTIAADPGSWKALTQAPYLEAGMAEQLAYVGFYETSGTVGALFPAGISPRGNASLSYPQKSLSIHLRGAYGQSAVAYPFWGPGSFLSYSFLVLRNGSQDILSARLRDSFANRAAENLRVMTARTRPVIVYVNGEYYGIMDLNEGMNQDYLSTHYGVDGSTVTIVQRNGDPKQGSTEEFAALRQFASTRNMADDEVLSSFAQRVDLDALTDYVIAQSFFGNYDIHNQNWWNAAEGTVLWQPILYDVDRCLNQDGASFDVLSMYFNEAGTVHNLLGDRIMMEIPCGLKKNAAWRQRFIERYAELICTEFSEERLLALLDEMAEALRPEMEEHTARWHMPASTDAWEASIQEMRACILGRYDVVARQIKSQFSLSDGEWDALLAKYR